MSSTTDRLIALERRLGSVGARRGTRAPSVPAPLSAGLALLPLRLFLGITFVYAGIQKLSDPGFLHSGAPTYIGTQLLQFASGTPGGFVLRTFALPIPAVAGVGAALVEIAVGLLVTVGLLTRLAAAVGLGLNLVLFLTASWKTYPYFLGSDIVFVFAWLPLVLAGTAGQPALERNLGRLAERRARAAAKGRPSATVAGGQGDPAVTRRTVLGQALGGIAVASGALAGIATLARGSYHASGSTASLAGHGSRATRAARRARDRTPSGGLPSGAVRLGPLNRLARGQAALYRDPSDGSPDVVVRERNGALAAHSAVCTHAGCTVGYSQGALVCPCHGSVFSPQTGAVEQGPATVALPARRVIEHGGDLYALPS